MHFVIVVKALWPPQTIVVCLWGGSNATRFFLLNFFKMTAIFQNIHRSIFILNRLAWIFYNIIRVLSPSSCVFTTMGEPNNMKSPPDIRQSPTDIFQTQPSPMPEEAPFDLSSSANTIPPTQKQKETAVSWSSHCVNKKSPCDYAIDRVEKYEKYFKDWEILPIPELVEAVEPKTLSFVVTDIKTKRLAGLKKETFEDLLKTANIPGKYFCRRSFAIWDVLLPSEEVAKSLADGNITTRCFRLKPEYRGKRRIRVTVCNVSMQLSGDVLAAYLSIYGGVEQVTQVTSTRGTAYGDYVFVMCLDRGGNKIPHKIRYRDQTMTVIVEGRKLLCWSCNKIGHFSKNCPQKPTITTTTTTTTTTTATPSPVIAAITPTKTTENQEENPKENEEGWTQVTRKKGGKKTPPKKPATTENKTTDATTLSTTTTTTKPTTTTTTNTKQSTTAKQSLITKDNQTTEPMSINLKRRRDSEDSPTKEGEKKHPKKPTQTPPIPQHKGDKTTEKSRPKSTKTSPIDSSPTKTKNHPNHPNGNTITPHPSFTN